MQRKARRRAEILGHFRPGRASSRSELARATGLSAATVSRITRDLVRGRVLAEIRRPGASVGRPSSGLELNRDGGRVLGVSLLYPTIRVVELDLRGDVVREAAEPVAVSRGKTGLLRTLRRAIRSFTRGPRRLLGLGLALPGQWDRESGVSLLFPRFPDWKSVPLRDLASEWAGVPADLIGYAPALALAEQGRRGPREPLHLVSVEVAENIAMGAVVNGRVLEGASGNAGELGHIPVDPAGPVCYCGSTGCLETRATVTAVVDEARGRFADPGAVTYADVVRVARSGDPACARLLERAARVLGTGLATALNLFNPEILVLGGAFFEAGDLVLGPLRASLREHAIASSHERLSIESSTLGPQAPALGAGLAAIRSALKLL